MYEQLQPFHAITISRLAHRLQDQGRSIIHMEFGQPATGAPAKAISTAHRILDSAPLGYWESTPLKLRLARHYMETYGLQVDPERFILTCGASPALVLSLLVAFEPGDRIALARPGYIAYRNAVRALHMVPVEIPCGIESRYQLSARALGKLETEISGLIVSSPANPTGTIIKAQELACIADHCSARGIRILSDEIYHGISYVEPARSMLEYDSRALIVNSFSKYYSMVGWRLGWLLAPPDLLERARTYHGNLFLTAPSLSQHAALDALDSPEELNDHVSVYARNRSLLLKFLPDLGLRAIAPPDGAFYVYANISHLSQDSLAFCERMLRETGVACAPGLDFDPEDGRHFIRFSFAIATAELEDALHRLKGWFCAQ